MAVTEELLSDLVLEVWDVLLGLHVEESVDGSWGEASSEGFTSTIQWTGASQGTLGLYTTVAFAELAAARMLNLSSREITRSDASDSCAELANVLGGNLQSVLPLPTHLSLPQVVTGTSPEFAACERSQRVVCLQFISAGQPVQVSITGAAHEGARCG